MVEPLSSPTTDPVSSVNIFDRSVKLLLRDVPAATCRLAGVTAELASIPWEDTAANLPELRADHLLIIERPPKRPWGMHVEAQLDPDRRVLPGWIVKNAAFNYQLEMPIVLVVMYLRKGKRKQFPSSCTIRGDGLKNVYRFEVIRLWEHIERIRHGDLQELAPLLIMCQDSPTVEVLEEERRIIGNLPVGQPVRDRLMGVAALLGSRYFSEAVISAVFGEDFTMVKQISFVERWIEEAGSEGEARAARGMLLTLLRERFGDLPAAVVERVESANRAWCEEVAKRLIHAQSLDELF